MTSLDLTPAIQIPIDAPRSDVRRRLPPYGREVVEEMSKHANPNVYILAGRDAWQLAQRRREKFGPGSVMVAPPNEDPAAFIWPALDAYFVDARGVARKDAVRLGAAIIACGTRFAALLGPRDEPMAFRRSA